MAYTSFHDRLTKEILPAVQKELGIKNAHAVPRIEKVVVSTGLNKGKMDSKETHAYVMESLAKITGMQPVKTKAKKAISNFKTREGMVVGAMATLRGPKMEEFLDRLLSYSLPRIRDFRGLPTKLDGRGNYSIGIRDHSIFPEVPPPDASQIFGLQIQITTTAEDDEAGRALLVAMGMPFRPKKKEEPVKKEEPKAEAPQEEVTKATEETEETKEDPASQETNDSEPETSNPEPETTPDTDS